MKNRYLANLDWEKILKVAAAAVAVACGLLIASVPIRACHAAQKHMEKLYGEESEERRALDQVFQRYENSRSHGN
jgi:hypothetical protein